LDELVWQDLCHIVAKPDLITLELERAQAGEWLPQALQAKRNTIRQALASLERQQDRLLEVYLVEIIMRDEFERKRQELAQTQNGLQQQLRQLEQQAQKQIETLTLANNIKEFCQRIQPTMDNLSFEQRRQLVELLIDRVIVDDEKVEIRYVIPTSPSGENTRFCHLRTDYLNLPAYGIDLCNQIYWIQGKLPNAGQVEVPVTICQLTDQAQIVFHFGVGRTLAGDIDPQINFCKLCQAHGSQALSNPIGVAQGHRQDQGIALFLKS
jgi:hypothetical protein